ncbi:MFS transporter [Streptomyces sp. WAC 06738]|uniref:MFS transporter n=1 Tax=Streptomyces sp. WAC 06738 TaxID=2203210 RepID=UPI000F7204DF|nr:MFS transporter [Streptomyces sp. WAC 06738]AZM47375.1 MFS transporter [Streptomyces sp. WAC 06738]
MGRVLRGYLATATCARLADDGMAVSVTLLALHRTGSAAQGAAVLAAWMAPHAVAAPLTGALAARARGAGAAFHVAALALFAAAIAGVALTLGRAPVPVVLAVAALGGCCGPMVTGGLSSLLAGLVPGTGARARAYALDAATYNAAGIAAPAAVTATAGVWGAGPAMGTLAVSAAGAAGLATTLRAPRPAGGAVPKAAPDAGTRTGTAPDAGETEGAGDGPRPTADRNLRCRGLSALWRELLGGLRVLWEIPALRGITAATSLAFVGIGGLAPAAVLLADERGYPGGGGVLLTVLAAGALAGALGAARRGAGVSDVRLAAVCLVGTGAALLGAAASAPYPLCVVLFCLAGLCDGPLLAATLRIRADHAPPAVRTQVFTLGAGLKTTAASAGAALTAAAASALSPAQLLAVLAAFQLAGGVLLRGIDSSVRPGQLPEQSGS